MPDDEVDQIDEIAALLSEAAETHHQVFRITDGEDPDWASWYAKWLMELSELPEILGADPVPSQLIYELVRLDREYTEIGPDEAWELYYARQLIDEFALDEDELDEDDEDEDEVEADEIDDEDGEYDLLEEDSDENDEENEEDELIGFDDESEIDRLPITPA